MSTIKEVAKIAGVSVGTVSHVIGGSARVSDQLRRKVLAAIRTLDYHPNHIARSLKARKTRTLGIVVPDITIPFFPQIIRSAESGARDYGYSVIAVSSEDNVTRQAEVLSLLRSQRVDGILLVVASGTGSQAQIRNLLNAGIPIVCVDRLPEGIDVDSVCVEDCAAADMGVSHLVSLGHKRIAILTGPLTLRNERERLRGYKAALEHAGIPPQEALIWETTLDKLDVIRTCKEHFGESGKCPTALFCTNGVIGLGALTGMAECGLSTPEHIAFVTFDELMPENIFRPAITAVVQPANELGYRAAKVLIECLKAGVRPHSTVSIRLQAILKVRESSSAFAFLHAPESDRRARACRQRN